MVVLEGNMNWTRIGALYGRLIRDVLSHETNLSIELLYKLENQKLSAALEMEKPAKE